MLAPPEREPSYPMPGPLRRSLLEFVLWNTAAGIGLGWVAGTPPDSGFILPAGSADIDTSQRINKRRNEALKFGPRSAAPDV